MSNYILVVDDNPSDLLITSAHLEKEGYEVVQATDGYDALDKLEEFRFRLLIVDLLMPNMGGIELIKRIKRTQNYKDIPILVTSARKEAHDVKLAVQVGANDYIVKPIDGAIFEEKIRRILGKGPDWTEYIIDQDLEKSLGYIKKPLKILSINEIGITILYGESLVRGESFEIGGRILGENFNLLSKVEDCTKTNELYRVKFSFVGTSEEHRKKFGLFAEKYGSITKKKNYKKRMEEVYERCSIQGATGNDRKRFWRGTNRKYYFKIEFGFGGSLHIGWHLSSR